jgi:hypothetical protein
MLAAHSFLTARVAGELKLTYAAAGPTELRIFLIGLTVAMYAFGTVGPHFGGLGPFDIVVGTAGLVLMLLFMVHTARMARRLAQQAE